MFDLQDRELLGRAARDLDLIARDLRRDHLEQALDGAVVIGRIRTVLNQHERRAQGGDSQVSEAVLITPSVRGGSRPRACGGVRA